MRRPLPDLLTDGGPRKQWPSGTSTSASLEQSAIWCVCAGAATGQLGRPPRAARGQVIGKLAGASSGGSRRCARSDGRRGGINNITGERASPASNTIIDRLLDSSRS